MLFSSATYLLIFLPLALAAFFLALRVSKDGAKLVIILVSLVFYGWASAKFLPLLIGSVAINYFLGRMIIEAYRRVDARRLSLLRFVGVVGNLALLIYFKYTNFFIENVNAVADTRWQILNIVLPLGISFFTFQRIAYLIDCARGEVTGGRFLDFAAISVFFPQLISGPIVLHNEAQPQFESRRFGSRAASNLTVGLVIFVIGLFKKVVLADNAGFACDPVFEIVRNGGDPGALAAWIAILAYTAELYFDFSGYSDMAIGSARMFGFWLPLNFHSPLKATSIIEYWRRWHMTLNRFMVRYFLPPLALGLTRRAAGYRLGTKGMFFASIVCPVFLTFVVIGIWHGAAWTYVLFGVLHAVYVSTNEIWRNFVKRRRKKRGIKAETPSLPGRAAAFALTIVCVLVGNVLFRSDSVGSALLFYSAMLGLGPGAASGFTSMVRPGMLLFVAAGWSIILLLPNTQQIMRSYRPAVNWALWKDVAPTPLASVIHWRPNLLGLAACGGVLAASITAIVIGMSREPAQFVYFQF
jgi:D-alanyl-lipoteichoic acid acyltransferase DltB (MBOAT superfamily)